jgi:hypothetical protein
MIPLEEPNNGQAKQQPLDLTRIQQDQTLEETKEQHPYQYLLRKQACSRSCLMWGIGVGGSLGLLKYYHRRTNFLLRSSSFV